MTLSTADLLSVTNDLMLDGIPVVVGLVDNSERFIFANDGYRNWIDREPKDIVGMSVREVLGAEAYGQIAPHIQQVLAGQPVHYSRYADLKIGRRFVECHYTPFVNKDGERVGYRFVAFDITQRREAEERLAESQARFASAFRHSAIGMALVGPDGRWIEVNPSLCKMLGYTAEELKATTFQALTVAEDLRSDLQFVQQMLAGERETYSMEKRYIHRSGTVIPACLTVSLIRNEDGRPLYFVSQVQDLSDPNRRTASTILKHGSFKADIRKVEDGWTIFLRGDPDPLITGDAVGQQD